MFPYVSSSVSCYSIVILVLRGIDASAPAFGTQRPPPFLFFFPFVPETELRKIIVLAPGWSARAASAILYTSFNEVLRRPKLHVHPSPHHPRGPIRLLQPSARFLVGMSVPWSNIARCLLQCVIRVIQPEAADIASAKDACRSTVVALSSWEAVSLHTPHLLWQSSCFILPLLNRYPQLRPALFISASSNVRFRRETDRTAETNGDGKELALQKAPIKTP